MRAHDPALTFLNALEGEWQGPGTVQMPTMAPVSFIETIRFSRRDTGSLDYWQRAERVDGTHELLHSEVGIWRLGSEGRLEISIAFEGATEIAEGFVQDQSIETVSTSVGRAATSTRFRLAHRRYRLHGDALSYDSSLESTSFPMSDHVRSELYRVGGTS